MTNATTFSETHISHTTSTEEVIKTTTTTTTKPTTTTTKTTTTTTAKPTTTTIKTATKTTTAKPTTTTAKTTTKTTTAATTTTTKSTKKTTHTRPVIPSSSSPKGYRIGGVPLIHQMPDFPTGCETVSAVMALRFWGEDVSVDTFIKKHLPQSSRFYWDNGKKYGPDPNEFFIGDPHSTYSYGCMAPVIETALISYFGSNNRVKNTTGKSLEHLCKTYIDKNMPVLLWVTIGMIDTKAGDQWYLEDGTLYEWPVNEHCMVLIGYDKNYYYFNDPYRGQMNQYAKWLVEKRYKELGYQSLVITD